MGGQQWTATTMSEKKKNKKKILITKYSVLSSAPQEWVVTKRRKKKKNKNSKHFTQNTKCKTMLLFNGHTNNEAQDRNMNIKIKSVAEKVSESIEDSSASKALMDTATMVGNKQLQKDKSSQQRNRQSW